MFNQPPAYESYIFRFWQERDPQGQQPTLWRFSLENAHTGVRLGFKTLEDMCHYLSQQIPRTPPKS